MAKHEMPQQAKPKTGFQPGDKVVPKSPSAFLQSSGFYDPTYKAVPAENVAIAAYYKWLNGEEGTDEQRWVRARQELQGPINISLPDYFVVVATLPTQAGSISLQVADPRVPRDAFMAKQWFNQVHFRRAK